MAEISGFCVPEVLYRVVVALRYKEVKQCRLVSSRWNDAGVEVLRSLHSCLRIGNSSELGRITSLLETSFQPLPFSALTILLSVYAAGMFEDGSLGLFMSKYGCQIRKVVVHGGMRVMCIKSFNSALNGVLVGALPPVNRLAVLDFSIGEWRSINRVTLQNLPSAFPNLRRLKVDFPSCEKLAQIVIARSPFLEILSIYTVCFASWNSTAYRRFIKPLIRLPKICANMPTSTRIELIIWDSKWTKDRTARLISKKLLPFKTRFAYFSANWKGDEKEFELCGMRVCR